MDGDAYFEYGNTKDECPSKKNFTFWYTVGMLIALLQVVILVLICLWFLKTSSLILPLGNHNNPNVEVMGSARSAPVNEENEEFAMLLDILGADSSKAWSIGLVGEGVLCGSQASCATVADGVRMTADSYIASSEVLEASSSERRYWNNLQQDLFLSKGFELIGSYAGKPTSDGVILRSKEGIIVSLQLNIYKAPEVECGGNILQGCKRLVYEVILADGDDIR